MRPTPRPSFWEWLKGLFRPAPSAPRLASVSEQEARVIDEFSRHYKINFHRPELLKLALTHRSYLSVTGQGPRESNERLEFLGDSVLGLVTSEYLYLQHPNEHEGQLTKTKSLLVSKAILSRRGLAMGLGRFVLMSHSEIESGGRQRLSIVADAFEAVIGAIYLDQGFDAARAYIERWLLRDYREIAADKRHTNYKSHLQEYVQSTFHTHPVYRIRSEMGPDHSKQFMVEVMVGRRTLGSGRGRNKKEAEQAAARDALEKVQHRPGESAGDSTTDTAPAVDARAGREGREPRAGLEPGRSRDWREGSESREPGGYGAAPRMPVAPELPAEPELEAGQVPSEPDGPVEDEGRLAGGRRRRGRRGGRGRRGRPEEEPLEGRAAPASPVAAREPVAPRVPAGPTPAAPARPGRGERPIYGADDPVPEVEPLPPAYEEDENEEIGRPEGPLEDRHIDPYEVLEDIGERASGRAVPGDVGTAGSAFTPAALPEPEDEWPAETESEDEDRLVVDADVEPPADVEPEGDEGDSGDVARGREFEDTEERSPTDSPRDEPRFGRRPGRSRRGGGA